MLVITEHDLLVNISSYIFRYCLMFLVFGFYIVFDIFVVINVSLAVNLLLRSYLLLLIPTSSKAADKSLAKASIILFGGLLHEKKKVTVYQSTCVKPYWNLFQYTTVSEILHIRTLKTRCLNIEKRWDNIRIIIPGLSSSFKCLW